MQSQAEPTLFSSSSFAVLPSSDTTTTLTTLTTLMTLVTLVALVALTPARPQLPYFLVRGSAAVNQAGVMRGRHGESGGLLVDWTLELMMREMWHTGMGFSYVFVFFF